MGIRVGMSQMSNRRVDRWARNGKLQLLPKSTAAWVLSHLVGNVWPRTCLSPSFRLADLKVKQKTLPSTMRTKGLLSRYHLNTLGIADQHTHHPDQHRGFAVTGYPCRSTLNDLDSLSRIIDFFGSISGRHSVETSVWALSKSPHILCQRLLHLLLPERVIIF
jgi:hypothetical protein